MTDSKGRRLDSDLLVELFARVASFSPAVPECFSACFSKIARILHQMFQHYRYFNAPSISFLALLASPAGSGFRLWFGVGLGFDVGLVWGWSGLV